ncbi:hypothetical protein A6R71_16665 [Xanthomonas translucens pv. arrhenatheri]|uniref:Lipoprotein n=1 Tax=Xanthomonas graminis pv. arrhenatheri LMG 727 TaxID=1195923 RepID=A0A0K2ZEF8_9XANT|nr:hypothetical protein [Xanthomonas translucens]OAX67007.1 hypothetical protein A6R71_16665 [Xanthomonas translucens pv. arrhenatheri]UKE78228.1 hypothetical protein KM317_02985 [Xanthomonas translucens pv. arrhenatheri]CTP83282.1 hypothetical protein XTALMG727_0580 [Xanthomonas translucens pv. arrhenatheri LMG 727]
MRMIYRTALMLLTGVVLTGCGNAENEVTQVGEVNLAGCEIPAGTKRADAEAIRCGDGEKAGADRKKGDDAPQPMNAPAVPDAEVIESALAAEVAKSDGASEYKDARKSVEADLTGDGKPEVVLLYTLEGQGGSNGAGSYLAAFQREEGGQLHLIGTTSVAGLGVAAQGLRVEDGTAHVTLLVPGPDDPDCCPSVEEDAMYVLHGNKWLQVQAQP